MWTGMMALVRGVIARSTALGSMLSVVGSTSTSTGLPPWWITTLAVAGKVMALVMTSSPRLMLVAATAMWSAAVQLLTAMACLAPAYSASICSNLLVFGPVVI